MLTGIKRKMVKETISYFIDTTGCSEDVFILKVQRNRGKKHEDLDYTSWLALECFNMLAGMGITLADCLEFRKMSKQIKLEKKGVYVPPLWKEEVGKLLQPNIREGSLLLELTNSIDSEFSYISNCDITPIGLDKVDFLAHIDFDGFNTYFLDSLPEEVKLGIKENKPLVFNINPYMADKPSTYTMLDEMAMRGYKGKKLQNLYYQYIYRLILLSQEYRLTDITVGIYGPLSMFKEEEPYCKLYEEFKTVFQFQCGICFDSRVIGVVDREKQIGYTVWKSKSSNMKNRAVVLDEKVRHTEDTILTTTKRLIRGCGVNLHDWCNKGQESKEGVSVPELINTTMTSENRVFRGSNVLGYSMSSSNLLRLTKRVGVTNLPTSECLCMTEFNFWQTVASFAARVCLIQKVDMRCKQMFAPDTMVEGYSEWLADALILFLFSVESVFVSYRREDFVVGNSLFPLTLKDAQRFITDRELLKDIKENPPKNEFLIKKLLEVDRVLSKEALDLFVFCKGKIRESLRGDLREEIGYTNDLLAWDASFYQIKTISKIFTSADEQKYLYLLDKLKDKLYDGVFTFGFISEN